MNKSDHNYSYARMVLLAVPLASLVVINSFIFPFVTSKALLFFFIIECALLLTVLYLRKDATLRIDVLTLLMLSFIGILTLTTVFSGNVHLHFWSTVERMDGLYMWLHLTVFYFLTTILFDKKHWQLLFIISFSTSSVVSFLGIAQQNGSIPLLNDEGRLDVIFGNPVFLSLFLLFNIGIGALLFVRSRGRSHLRLLLSVLLAVHIFVLIGAGTRGSLLAFVAALAVSCFVYAISSAASTQVRYLCVAVVTIAIAVVGVVVLVNDHPLISSTPILERFSVLSLSNIQNQARYYIWEAAIDGISNRPLVGYGIEGFSDVFIAHVEPAYFGENLSSLPQPWVDRAHNVFLDITNGAGVIAGMLFVAVGLYVLYVLFTTTLITEVERSILIATFVAYVVHSMFTFNTVIGYVWLIIIVGYAASLNVNRWQREYVLPGAAVVLTKVACPILVIVTLLCTGNRVLFMHELRTLHDTTSRESVERFMGYVELAEHNFIDRHYLFSELPYLGVATVATAGTSEKQQLMQSAILAAEESLRSYGALSIKDLYYFSQYYRGSGILSDAERVLTESLARTDNNPLMLMERGLLAFVKKEDETALAFFRKAYVLERTNREAVIMYAGALLRVGRSDEADAVMQRYYGENVSTVEILEEHFNVE